MSKLRLFFILPLALLFYFLLPSPILATSGCCSYHGGVNCSAGAQYNGRVICNDGWTGSSCYYSEMVMCGGSSYSIPTTPSCPLNSRYNSLSESCECYSGYISQGGSCVSANSYCWDEYGYNSRYNSIYDSCECSYGYVFNSSGTKCISDDQACQDQYGFGSKASLSGDKCECKYGYEWQGNRCAVETYNPSTTNYDFKIQTNTPTSRPTKTPTPRPTNTPTSIPTATNMPTLIPTSEPTATMPPQVQGASDMNEPTSEVASESTSNVGIPVTLGSIALGYFGLRKLFRKNIEAIKE